MESKGNDALLKQTKVSEWTFNHGGYIPLTFGGLLLLGCVTAYVIAVARGNVDAILPLISDAAGSPPQNGLFGTLVCLGGMCGVVFMLQRYMIVLEKNMEHSGLVTVINKLSLCVGIGSMLGITLITGYPVNFYRNRDIWLYDVGLPHMIGGVMLFALGLLYIALQCMLTLFLKQKHENILTLRVLLLLVCTASFVYHMITVPDNFGGISHLYYINNTDTELNYTGLLPYPPTMGASLRIPIDTSGSYVTSALTEWAFVFFFCCFFFTFYGEANEYSLLLVVETHSTHEHEDDGRTDFGKIAQNGSQVEKPPPELRKVLRRDSSCQTTGDGPEKVITPTKYAKKDVKPAKKAPAQPPKIEITNGTQKVLANSDMDAKLDKLLNESVSLNDYMGISDTVSVKVDASSEEEKAALEEMDGVVKAAEDESNEAAKEAVKTRSSGTETASSACSLSIQ